MVEVVVPLPGEPVTAGLTRGDQPRVVEVGLGDQDRRPPRRRGEPVRRGGQFLQDVQDAVIFERMHRVEPQPVDVIVQ